MPRRQRRPETVGVKNKLEYLLPTYRHRLLISASSRFSFLPNDNILYKNNFKGNKKFWKKELCCVTDILDNFNDLMTITNTTVVKFVD